MNNNVTSNKIDDSKEEVRQKILWTVEDVMVMTGLGEKKVREILNNPKSGFTVKNGNRVYAHKELFEDYMKKCAKLNLTL